MWSIANEEKMGGEEYQDYASCLDFLHQTFRGVTFVTTCAVHGTMITLIRKYAEGINIDFLHMALSPAPLSMLYPNRKPLQWHNLGFQTAETDRMHWMAWAKGWGSKLGTYTGEIERRRNH